jgi:hypothetical protein
MFFKALMPASTNPRPAANFYIVTVPSLVNGPGASAASRRFATELKKGAVECNLPIMEVQELEGIFSNLRMNLPFG